MTKPVKNAADIIRIAYSQMGESKTDIDLLAYEKYRKILPDVNEKMTYLDIIKASEKSKQNISAA